MNEFENADERRNAEYAALEVLLGHTIRHLTQQQVGGLQQGVLYDPDGTTLGADEVVHVLRMLPTQWPAKVIDGELSPTSDGFEYDAWVGPIVIVLGEAAYRADGIELHESLL